MSRLSALQTLNRRQSLSLAAGVLLASCGRRGPSPPAATAPGGASASAPVAARPPAVPPIQIPANFAGLADPVAVRFYHQRGWRPAWNPGLSQALTLSLGEARRHALEHVAFAPRTTPGAVDVRPDITLTLTALRYAQALSSGYVDPRRIEKVFTLERNKVDLASGLEQALAAGRLTEWLASLPPSDDEYRALSTAYYPGAGGQAGPAARPAPPEAPEPPPTKTAPVPDAPAPDVSSQASPPADAPPQAAAPPPAAPSASPPPQGPVVQTPPAAPAPDTAGARGDIAPRRVIVASADRARQLAANLERRRWLARAPAARRIDVNTAACFLTYLKPGADPWAARVVLGKKGHETPSLQASFHRVVANPPWRVPMDIARKEIFPKGAGYLRRAHMRVINGQVVQQPGPNSSLGLVKFDVQDPYAIYLHDTPSKGLFALAERHKSHGCVRVQDAVGFARRLAGEAGRLDAFNEALASGKTREVDIGAAIPVRLLYHTAYAGEDGQVVIIPDAYGWNDRLAAALGFRAASAKGAGDQRDIDLGP